MEAGPLNVTDSTRQVKCAIWWPARAHEPLADIDLDVISPVGQVIATSAQRASVWEKVTFALGAGAPRRPSGMYSLRARAVALAAPPQLVHVFCYY
jgi:hypothetical protein